MGIDRIKEIFESHRTLLRESENLYKNIGFASEMITEALKKNKKILICGNGGSAADAQHIAGEFVNKFVIERAPLPAIALTTDTSILTAIGNDSTFDDVFKKQVDALGSQGDVLVAISTSGKSRNVLAAISAAKNKKMKTIGLAGSHPMNCDIDISVPSTETPRVQEIHMLIYHIICEMVEYEVTKGG